MSATLEPGDVIRDKYRVERVIGRGGMGRVLAAWHLDLEMRVAIKVLLPELREHKDLVDRFLREARAASRLDGHHVARILDVDRLADGTPFIVMEYLEGHDLSQIRRSRSPARIRDAVEYAIQACDAIGQAHARGIVHRDIKPANLFLAKSVDGGPPKIKVLDFGISKMTAGVGQSEPSMTSTSVVMGSAEYMSPEQMLSAKDVDGRTDIWALGVVLFEILTATPPFIAETLPQVCALVLSKPPPRPRALRPDLPEVLEQTILRCLEKDRDARFATAGDLSLALQGCLSSTNLGLGPVSVAATTDPVPVLPMMVPVAAAHAPASTGTVALPVTPVPVRPAASASPSSPGPDGPRTSEGTSISRPPPAWPTPPHASSAANAPSAHGSSAAAYAPIAVHADPSPSAPPTHTPYSRDFRDPPPPRRGRGGLIVGAILGLVVAGIAVGLGVKAAMSPATSRTTVAAPGPSSAPEVREAAAAANSGSAPSGASSTEGDPEPEPPAAEASSAVAGSSSVAPASASAVSPPPPLAKDVPPRLPPTPKTIPSTRPGPTPVTTSGID